MSGADPRATVAELVAAGALAALQAAPMTRRSSLDLAGLARARPAGRDRPFRPLRRPVRPRSAGRGARRAQRRVRRRPRWTRPSSPNSTACSASYAGRPTPHHRRQAAGRARAGGARILLKREDLAHTGSHKINNVLGQALLTVRMGKKRVIAETGAGQHGVATATACALLGLECVVYMGEEDTVRQALNVARMRLLGADGHPGHDRQPHPQGRHQRGDARLGHQRRDHALLHRLGGGPAPVPDDGPRLPAGDRRRGARPDARAHRPAARRGRRLRRRRLQRDRHVHRRSSPTPSVRAGRLRGRRRRRRDRPARGDGRRRLGRRPARHAHLPAAGRGRPDPRRPTRISAGLDYPGVGPEHAWLRDQAGRRVPAGRRRRGDGARSASWPRPRASCRRSRARTPSPARCDLAAGAAAPTSRSW